MPDINLKIEGKCACLDAFDTHCTIRANDDGRTRTISYGDLSNVEFQNKQSQTDGFICFTLKSGKRIRFYLKSDDESLENAKSVFQEIENLVSFDDFDVPVTTTNKRYRVFALAALCVVFAIFLVKFFDVGNEPVPQVIPTAPQTSNDDFNNVDQEPDEPLVQADNATLGERNALESALNYLDFMAFSKKGLIEQLEYEGYTKSEANYAVNNCGADWNEQAAKSAENYLSIMSFSREGLIEQLEYEGFTNAQAKYGVKANGY